MRHWIIYLILNTVNGKKYVGQTVQGLGRRWTKHTHNAKTGSSSALGRAIRKYGAGSFELLEIASCADKAEADSLEKAYILQHRSNCPEFGYNLTEGGDGITGWHHSDEVKARLSALNVGKKLSEEQRTAIGNFHRGRKRSLETRARIRAAHLGKKRGPRSEAVKQKISARLMGHVDFRKRAAGL
jgi:group I intron endonuclease